MKTKKAFTLVEILVVVTIISMLASLAAVSYSQFVKQGRDAKRKTDVEQIRAAIELYRNFNNTYPATGTLVFGSGKVIDPGGTIYLSKIPNDPISSYTYYYVGLNSNQDYELCAYLENGGTSVGGTTCGPSALACNYCMGPYGQK